jgi:site-specific DNA-cytosine methylase
MLFLYPTPRNYTSSKLARITDKMVVQRVPLKFLNRNQKKIEGDYAFTVDSLNTGGVMVDYKVRRLTHIECERLQGFPDNWTAGVSDTQRYKQLGNAVTVNVVEEIVKRFDCLEGKNS